MNKFVKPEQYFLVHVFYRVPGQSVWRSKLSVLPEAGQQDIVQEARDLADSFGREGHDVAGFEVSHVTARQVHYEEVENG